MPTARTIFSLIDDRTLKARVFILITALLVSILATATQTLANQHTHDAPSPSLPMGLIVEKVEVGSQAEKAGLRKGDLLLNWWSAAQDKRSFQSPFDLSTLEIELGQREPVMIEGTRGALRRSWTLGPGNWGINVRPNLSNAEIALQSELQGLIRGGSLNQTIGRGESIELEGDTSSRSWLRYWLFLNAADSAASAKNWKRADQIYQEATRIPGIPPTISVHLFLSWASTYIKRGDSSNAEFCYQQALAESQKLTPENLLVAFTLNSLGTVAYRRGDLDLAETHYAKAWTLAERLAPKSLGAAKSLNGLGNVAQARSDLAKAEEYHLQALGIRESLVPGGVDVAASLNNLGNVAESRGDLRKAESYHRRALIIRETLIPNSTDHVASLLNLGVIASESSDLISAERFWLRSLAIAQKLAPDGREVAAVFNNLAFVAVEQGELSMAETYNRKALAIEEKLSPGSLDVAQSLHNLGDVAQRGGNVTAAEQYQNRALAIQKRLAPDSLDVAITLDNLASLARGAGDLARAEEYYRKALAIRETLAPGSKVHAQNLAALASVLRAKRQLDEAAKLFAQALDAFDNQTAHLGGSDEVHVRFRAQHAKYYREYIDLLFELQQPELALNAFERSRARTLLEMLSEAQIDVRKGVDASLLERERVLQQSIERASDRRIRLFSDNHTKGQLTTINREINDLLSQYQQVRGEIRSSSPSYAALTQPQPTNVKHIQQDLLDEDTLLLEYMLGEKRSYLWVVGQNSFATFQLPARADIESVARRLFASWTARSQITTKETAPQKRARLATADAAGQRLSAALSEMVLGPGKEILTGKRLLIVGDGALLYIPFAALPIPTLGHESPGTMVEKYEIINLPSASVLSVLHYEEQKRARASKGVVVLADPVFERSDTRVRLAAGHTLPASHQPEGNDASSGFSTSDRLLRSITDIGGQTDGVVHLHRLPYTRQEAEAIFAVTPTGQGTKALDFQANRAMATSPELTQHKIVHFATHGLIDSKNPQLSGLVFSLVDRQGRPQEGFLELQDIYNLDLPVELIVLSACETGLGKEIDGEGLVGLTRGFMYAGASRVVASLWKVSDVATADLMTYFYQAMEQKGMAAAPALRFAQIQMLKKRRWTPPYYWAAFQIHGEWR